MLSNTVQILKYIDTFSKKYFDFFKDFDKERFASDQEYALSCFFERWGLERSGSTKAFKITALKFIAKNFESLNSSRLNHSAQEKDYIKLLGSDKANSKLNPFLDENLKSFDVLKVVNLLKEHRISEAYQEIKLQGIGPKIKKFFLRDISCLYCPKRKYSLEEQRLMFPIDIWLKEFIKGLNLVQGKDSSNENKYVTAFLGICNENGIDFRTINASIWLYCANVAATKERLAELLKQNDAGVLKQESEWRYKFVS